MANIQSIITYNANLTPAQAQIKALTGQVAGLTAAFNTLDRSALNAQRSLASTFATSVGQIGGFTTQTIAANSAVENFGKQLAANKLTMREYFREAFSGYTKQNSMLKQLAAQQVRYQQSVAVSTGAGQGMLITPNSLAVTGNAAAIASQKFSIFNELITGGANRLLNFGKNTQWAGRQLMVGFTMPLALFAATTSKTFRDLDIELTRFAKVYGKDLGNSMSDATARMREEVKQLAFDISRTYGIAAKDTAALAADIAATGAEGNKLIASVQQTTRLSVLGEVDRQDAMKATLALQSAFKMNTDELSQSINFLNAVENQTSTTLNDLAGAIPKVGPVIRSLGGDVKDLSVLLVAMKEGGVPAAEAANALKSGLASLINPTKQASEVAKKFGVDLEGIVKANKGELMPTIYAVQNALSGLDSFARSQVIEQIFGKYQFARMTALFDNLGKSGSQTQQVLELASKNSTDLAAIANKEIKTLTESTAVRFQRALEQLKNTLMPIGQTLTETFIPIFEFLGKGLSKAIEFFQSLPEPVKNFAKYGTAIAALAGPVIMLVGLFGNLIANGIKFGLMITRLGARMTGLKVEKFELLNAEVMAAKLGIDNLTTSFVTQEQALGKLAKSLGTYAITLKELSITNPGLFIPAAMPGGRGQVPIRRQDGSSRPEIVPGSGRGDHIPALLEPGEFVVNRNATQKYGHILLAMNRGTIKGFQSGHLSLRGGQSNVLAPYTVFAPGNRTSGFGMSPEFFAAGAEFEKSMRASAMTAVAIEKDLKFTDKTLSSLSKELEPISTKVVDALRLTATEMQNAGEDVTHISQVMDRARPKIDKIITSISDPKISAAMQKLLYPTNAQVAAGGNIRVPTVVVDPKTNEVIRRTQYSQRTGEAASFQRRVPTAAAYLGVPTSGSYTRAHLGAERIAGPVFPIGGGAMGGSIQIQRIAKQALDEYLISLGHGVAEATKSASPSKEADQIGEKAGRNIGQGALNGLQRGLNSPNKGGIESITDAQKIATAQKGRLAIEEKMLPIVAQRLRVESDITALTYQIDEIKKNEKLTSQQKLQAIIKLNEEQTLKQKELLRLKAIEERYQNLINQNKEKITKAEYEQLQAEQKEAQAAVRRAEAAATGPGANVRNAQRNGMRGQNAMNAAMGISMAASMLTMLSGATGETADKMIALSSAITSLLFVMQAFQGFGLGGKAMGIAGMAGRGLAGLGGRLTVAAGGTAATNLATRTVATTVAGTGLRGALGAGLTGLGGGLAGGGIGAIAGTAGVAAALAAVGVGLYLYKRSLDEARDRAIAAFKDPVATVEYFGKSVKDITETLSNIEASHASQALSDINDQLREAVKSDYGSLIEKIKNAATGVGAADLGAAYQKMIVSGLSAQEAMDSVKAIAAEAGTAGGEAYAQAFGQGLLGSKTPEEAFNQMLAMIDPNSQYNKDRVAGLQAQAATIRSQGKPGYRGGVYYTQQQQDQLGSINEAMQVSGESYFATLQAAIQLSQTAPEKVAKSAEQIKQAYMSLSTDGGGLFGMGQSAQEVAFDSFKNMIGELNDPRLNKIMDSLQNATPEAQGLAQELVAVGGSLNDAADAAGKFDMELARAAIRNTENLAILNQQVIDAQQNLTDFVNNSDMEAKIKKTEDSLSRISDKRDAYIKSREKQRDKEEEFFQDSQDGIQSEIDALNKEQNDIQKTTDKYIKSLQSRSRAESYYAEQRKTSFGALSKLAAGDVFGFLQERQQMSARAQQYSYEEEIKAIEDRRDTEVEAIQKDMDKKQELMDLNAKAHEDQMKAFDDETKKHSDELDKQYQRQSSHSASMKTLLDVMKRGEIQNYEDVKTEFGKNLADEYKMLVEQLIRNTSAKYQVQVAVGEMTVTDAQQGLIKMYNALSGVAYFGGTPTSGAGYGGVGSYSQLQDVLGLPSMIKGPPVRSPGYGPGSTTTTNGGTVEYPSGSPGTFRGQTIVEWKGHTFKWIDGEGWQLLFADGGHVSGPGGPKSDVIPAMLSNGEYVIQASSVSKYGKPMMDALNAGKYAKGGIIKAGNGIHVSADAAERAAQSRPTYFGVTPNQLLQQGAFSIPENVPPLQFANGGPADMKKYLDKWVGSKIKYYSGWDSAGSWGKSYPAGVLMHHTAAPATDAQVQAMKDGYVWNGEFIKGPIVQSVISRDGTGNIIGYGNRNTGAGTGTTAYMGRGNQKDLGPMKSIIDALGSPNPALFQMEVISEGIIKDFTAEQFDTIAKITAALREWMGWPTFSGRIINHKDWAVGRKDDTLYPRSVFQANAESVWNEGVASTTGGGPATDTTTSGNNTKVTGGTKNITPPSSIESVGSTSRTLPGILSLLNINNTTKLKPGTSKTPSQPGTSKTPSQSGNDGQNNFGTGGIAAVKYALSQIDDPYSYSANPPESWDCSKLTAWAWAVATGADPKLGYNDKNAKVRLTPLTYSQVKEVDNIGTTLDPKKWTTGGLPGDLLFFFKNGQHHVSMYMGNGKIVEASSPEAGLRVAPYNYQWNIDNFSSAGRPKGFAVGGSVTGPGGPRSDMIPAMLSHGEYVVKADSVNKYGKNFMDKVNSGTWNPFEGVSAEPIRFAGGGMIGSMSTPSYSLPQMSSAPTLVGNSYGGNSSSTQNTSNVKVIINGASNKGAKAIANKVISIINEANSRRNHSRSI